MQVKTEFRGIYFLILMTMRDVSTSFVEIFADFLITCIRFGLILILYKYVFDLYGGTVMGVNYMTIAWSMFFYFMFMLINPRHLCRYIQSEIQGGTISRFIGKPLSFFGYLFGSYIGRRLHLFLIQLILGIVVMFGLFGFPEQFYTFNFWITLPFVFIFCFLISFFMSAIIGLISFWIEDINPINWITDKFVMILGGAYFPVALFPPIMQNLIYYTPFGASQLITSIVYTSWQTKYLFAISMQLFWATFTFILLYIIYKKALQNLNLNGG